MGLFAVARLAERHGVRVRLRPGSPHGLTALVWLPDSITEREAGVYGTRSRMFAARSGFQGRRTETMPPAVGPRLVPDALPASHRRSAVATVVPEPASYRRRDALVPGPAGYRGDAFAAEPARPGVGETMPTLASAARPEWFRSRSSSASGVVGPQSSGPHDRLGPSADPSAGASGTDGWWAAGRHAAQIMAEPVRGDLTAAGLPTRVPRANLIPGSASAGRPAAGGRSAGSGARPAGSGGAGDPGPGYDTPGPATPLAPEVARSRMGGFQSGGRRAMSQTENSAEGAE
jgi:hypothetical protein